MGSNAKTLQSIIRHVLGGVQDLREDFSVDFTDNYRRLMGLEGTGQLPAVSAIGMPFDCFTDGDQATRWLLFHSRNS